MYDLKSVFLDMECLHGTDGRAIRTDQGALAEAARECHIGYSDGVERDAVSAGAGMQACRPWPVYYGHWNS